MKDILNMTSEEFKEYANKEAAKAEFNFINWPATKDLPEEYVTAVNYIYENIYNCDFYHKDKYDIALVEEYIPMGGMIWRIIIFDKNKAMAKLEEVNVKNIKRVIGGSQVVSIYYDTNDVLGVMGKPYFEIYDGNDVERFFANEYKDLYNCIEDILSRIIH